MWRVIAIALILAGCAQIPPTPQEIEAKQFGTVPDKAVIYIARTSMDSHEAGSLILDDWATLTTYRATFYRWEVTPGRHRIAGYAGQSGVVELDAEAGKIYFIEHTVLGTRRSGVQWTFLKRIDGERGRRLVSGSQLL